jgi:glycosyltransferase involved in cell wall biosynthesis
MSAPVLFVDQSGQPGGAELCLMDLAAGLGGSVLLLSGGPFEAMLRGRGVDVSVLSAGEALHRAEKGTSGLRLARGVIDAMAYLPRLRAATGGRALLYFNTAKALVLGRLARPAHPAVFHLHDLPDPSHFSKTNIRLLVATANRTSAVIANSRATATAFRAAGGRAPVTVIPNGFDPEVFDGVDGASVRALRDQWNPRGAPVLAVFGRLSRWKGQDLLIQAARGLPDAVVWIVGDAFYTDDDRAYAHELRILAADPALGGRIVFAGHRGDVPVWMKAADVVVHTSVSPEPFGRVIIEAMLAGKPVVAADAGGPSEILDHGKTGILYPPGDLGALEDALRGILGHPSAALELGRKARDAARANYALPGVLARTRAVIDPLITR